MFTGLVGTSVKANGSSTKSDTWRLLLAAASVILAVPGAVFNTIRLSQDATHATRMVPSWLVDVASFFLATSIVGWVLFLFTRPALWLRILKPVAHAYWGHPDQRRAQLDFPHYLPTIHSHVRLSAVSGREAAKKLRIPFPIAWYFLSAPKALPRESLISELERLLLLPPQYFRKGGPYGPEVTRQRLLRLSGLMIGTLAPSEILAMSGREASAALRKLEEEVGSSPIRADQVVAHTMPHDTKRGLRGATLLAFSMTCLLTIVILVTPTLRRKEDGSFTPEALPLFILGPTFRGTEPPNVVQSAKQELLLATVADWEVAPATLYNFSIHGDDGSRVWTLSMSGPEVLTRTKGTGIVVFAFPANFFKVGRYSLVVRRGLDESKILYQTPFSVVNDESTPR